MSLANQLASVCLIAGLSVAALPSAYAAGASLTFHTTRITDIKLRKVKSSKSKTGYWFEISGTIINIGKEELDWGRELAICSSVELVDNSGVKLNGQRCEFPDLLPSQSKKGVIFAGGPAMPSATGAKLCYGHLWERRCTPILPLQK